MPQSKYRHTPAPISGMPSGIPYIVGNEAAERFSFYGMKAILAIFMTKYLVDAAGQSDVMTEEEARTWVHLFVASAYFFPILGALVSDWLLGKYRTIISLSLVYCAGHAVLALNNQRIGLAIGLTLIAIGSGGIKPCVSAHVGDQFGRQNQHLLSRVFSWFYFAINLGAFASTLLTPWLLNHFGPGLGPHIAFGVPGALMLLATWVFWLGRQRFVHVPAGGAEFVRESFSGQGLRALLNLGMIYVFVAMFWALFDQTASAWVLQAESMDRTFLGVRWLSSQIQAVNPILILVLIPLFSYVIYPAAGRVFPLTPLRKVAIGFFVTVPAFAVPALIESNITGGRFVQFRSPDDSPGTADTGLNSPPHADPEAWHVMNLIDGQADGTGWVSGRRPESPAAESSALADGSAEGRAGKGATEQFFPIEMVVRLRERRAWEVDMVQINPRTDLQTFLAERTQRTSNQVTAEDVRRCWARDVEVLVGASPVGPWESVGRFELARRPEFQSLSFSPVTTEYVMLRIHSNWGGDYVSLGEIETLATAAAPPAGADQHAAGVWPNVAALGYRPSIVWQLLAYGLITAAEIMVSITCLEFSYTQAPRRMKSIVMSVYLLSISAGNLFTSLVNRVIQNPDGTSKLPGPSYYWFFTGAMLVTAVVFILVARAYRGRTYIQGEDAGEPEWGAVG
ncbi:MAG TPA: MFS transporter [Planctomycetaceae bacterium]|nr:MFS transporter [Planctomycetaceae bacterium]